jgi:predicted metal-binding protein
MANGKKVSSATLTASDDWTYTFEDLAKYSNGKAVEYTVEETKVDDQVVADSVYTSSISGSAAKGYVITNTYAPETTSVKVTKAWNDADNQDGNRPDSITVNLYANGEKVMSKTITSSDNWTYTFNDLAKYENGSEIAYSVDEALVGKATVEKSGYTAKVTEANKNEFVITNSYAAETTSVKVTKAWKDGDNQDGTRADNVTVDLLANGQKVDSTILTAEDNWTYTFEDLAKYENGKEIEYTVEETKVGSEALADSAYTSSVTGNAAKGYVITNSYGPEKVTVKISKVWDDANNQDGKRPESVTVALYANGEKISTKTIGEADNWSWTFDNLAKFENGNEVKYTVKEVLIGDETVADSVYTPTITGQIGNTFVIKNSYTPETISISGVKTWDDEDNQDGKRPESVTINLLANGTKVASKVVSAADKWSYTFDNVAKYENGKEINYSITEDAVENYSTTYEGYNVTNSYTPGKVSVTVSKSWDDEDDQDAIRPDNVFVELYANGKAVEHQTLTLNADNQWTASFTNLPEYDGGRTITYTVKEVSVDGYTPSISGNAKEGYVITNTHTPDATVEVSGTKTWDDANDQDGKRPESITINLFANGTKVDSKVVTAADNWSYTFDHLAKNENGKEIMYSITEDAIEDYSTSYHGYDVTNTYTPGEISVTVTKKWRDYDDLYLIRPDEITVDLLANGKVVKTLTISESNLWTMSFEDMPEYENGEKIDYTVKEHEVEGYTCVITGSVEKGFAITNTLDEYTDRDPNEPKNPGLPSNSEDPENPGSNTNDEFDTTNNGGDNNTGNPGTTTTTTTTTTSGYTGTTARTPSSPSLPSSSSASSSTTSTNTSYNSNETLWGTVLLAACCGLAVILALKKKRETK